MITTDRSLDVRHADGSIIRATLSGPESHLPGVLFGFEDYHNPRVTLLRKRYRIDEAVQGESSEFRRLLKLRHWVCSQLPIDNSQGFPYRCPFEVLDHARTGAGFHCAHASMVMHSVYAAFGYTSRILYIDVDHRIKGRSGHHGVDEVWSNDLCKWIAIDPKYDLHFEQDGQPLSASELHTAVRENGGRGIVKVKGLSRRKFQKDDPKCHGNVGSYFWVSYVFRSDIFTHPEWALSDGTTRLAVWDNEHWRNDTWMRNSGPGGSLVKHHAYAKHAFVPIHDLRELNWTPGIPILSLRQQKPGMLAVHLASATPNFKAYLFKRNKGPWKAQTNRSFDWQLSSGSNRLQVRTENLFGVLGPVIEVKVIYHPQK